MKKIILMLISVFGIVSIIPNAYAYDYGTTFQDYIDFPVTQLQQVQYNDRSDVFGINIDSEYRSAHIDTRFINGTIYFDLVLHIPEVSGFKYEVIQTVKTSYLPNIWFYDISSIYYKINDNNSDPNILDLYIYDIGYGYFDQTAGDTLPDVYFTSIIDSELTSVLNYNSGLFDYQFDIYNKIYAFTNYDSFNNGYQQGQQYGYDTAKGEYGYYNGTNWITATVHGSNRYNAGLNENKEYYGIYYNDTWLTAEQYGLIRYGIGYEKGLITEIDWFEWSMTFFLMPFRILNIQILPGIRIGYFALFSLLLGVVGWFFFIVGKGGGRKK